MSGNYIGANAEWHESTSVPSNYGSNMTMVCCFRVAVTTNAEYLFWMGDGGLAGRYMGLRLQSDGTISGEVRSAGASAFLSTATASYSANAWNYIGLDKNGSAEHNLWYNGAADIQDTTSITLDAGWDGVSLGQWRDSTPSNGTNCDIAWAAMWGSTLSANEHAALAAGIHPAKIQPHNLGDYWEVLNISGRSLVRGIKGINLVENGSVNYIGDHSPMFRGNNQILVNPQPSAGGILPQIMHHRRQQE